MRNAWAKRQLFIFYLPPSLFYVQLEKIYLSSLKNKLIDNFIEVLIRFDTYINFDRWDYDNNVNLDYSRPGKSTDNPFIESFNSSFRN